MSLSTPASYVASAAPQLGVPSVLQTDPLLSFKGSRSVIKYVPANTGSSIGPSSSVLFQIPQSLFGFIKPGSMYLRCQIDVTQTGAAGKYWSFAGQQSDADATITDEVSGYGGASAIINRITIQFPGGVQMSYPYYADFRAAIFPHTVNVSYMKSDLRQLEFAGVVREVSTASTISRTCNVCIPLDIPAFNSAQAMPLLLLSSGISMEIVTETVANAFWSSADPNHVTNYSVSNMALVYEELVVSPEFKTALLDASAARPFSIGVADRTWMGGFSGQGSSRTNIGVGLSSLKSIVGTFKDSGMIVSSPKRYTSNGLTLWNLYINGQQVTPSNLDSDSFVYAEFQRAIQTLGDFMRSGSLAAITNPTPIDGATTRTYYNSANFAFGVNVAVYNDAAFALSGIPCDQLSLELQVGTQSGSKWGPVETNEPSMVLLWGFHDTVLTVLPDGTMSIRK
jgi:hypothetical protein